MIFTIGAALAIAGLIGCWLADRARNWKAMDAAFYVGIFGGLMMAVSLGMVSWELLP